MIIVSIRYIRVSSKVIKELCVKPIYIKTMLLGIIVTSVKNISSIRSYCCRSFTFDCVYCRTHVYRIAPVVVLIAERDIKIGTAVRITSLVGAKYKVTFIGSYIRIKLL